MSISFHKQYCKWTDGKTDEQIQFVLDCSIQEEERRKKELADFNSTWISWEERRELAAKKEKSIKSTTKRK